MATRLTNRSRRIGPTTPLVREGYEREEAKTGTAYAGGSAREKTTDPRIIPMTQPPCDPPSWTLSPSATEILTYVSGARPHAAFSLFSTTQQTTTQSASRSTREDDLPLRRLLSMQDAESPLLSSGTRQSLAPRSRVCNRKP